MGWSSKLDLQQILGIIASLFVFRRECFAVCHHIFLYVESLGPRWYRLPDVILDELRFISLVLPFASANIRAEVSTTITATDATPSSGGTCHASIPISLARELYRSSEYKGAHVRLDDGSDPKHGNPVKFEKAEAFISSSAGTDAIVSALSWKAEAGYSLRKTAHINLQARALRREVVRQVLRGSSRSRRLFVSDYMVVVGATAKGRSSSFKLNGI